MLIKNFDGSYTGKCENCQTTDAQDYMVLREINGSVQFVHGTDEIAAGRCVARDVDAVNELIGNEKVFAEVA